jgi:flagellar biosynthesis/type III secretory pathway protein FliH
MNRNRRFAAALATTALLSVPAVGLVSASSAGAATVPSYGATVASQSPYKAGFRAGYSDGFEDAKDDCDRQQQARLITTHQQDDYDRGYADGYDRGYSKAYDRFCWDD